MKDRIAQIIASQANESQISDVGTEPESAPTDPRKDDDLVTTDGVVPFEEASASEADIAKEEDKSARLTSDRSE